MNRNDMYIPIILLLILIMIDVSKYSMLLSLLVFVVICVVIYYKYTNKNLEIGYSTKNSIDYTGKSISAFYFMGNRYNVNTWKELLMNICLLMYKLHKEKFDIILDIPGRKRQYFTYHPEKLNSAEKISDTNIFMETKLGSNSIVGLCYDIIKLFGYSNDDLGIEIND